MSVPLKMLVPFHKVSKDPNCFFLASRALRAACCDFPVIIKFRYFLRTCCYSDDRRLNLNLYLLLLPYSLLITSHCSFDSSTGHPSFRFFFICKQSWKYCYLINIIKIFFKNFRKWNENIEHRSLNFEKWRFITTY